MADHECEHPIAAQVQAFSPNASLRSCRCAHWL